MNNTFIDKKILAKFGRATIITGILLIILGTAGIILPSLLSLGTAIMITWLFIIGGILWAVHTWQYHRRNIMDWLKPILLLISGGLMLSSPTLGVEAIGLMLAFYLLLHAFGSFAYAQSIYPRKGWGWLVVSGVASTLLAMMFMIGWPANSLWLVGLYIGITLFFDGWALLTIGLALRKNKSE